MKVLLALVAVFLLAAPTVPMVPTVPLAPGVTKPGTTLDLLYALPAYDTLEEAGVHAIERAYRCSHVYECGGPIAQRPDGKYVVGPVHSSYAGDSLDMHHGVPLGWKLAADYHTHPCLPQHHDVPYFSPQDLEGYLSEHLPGFMGDLCTGNVHLFVPGKDAPDNEQPPKDPDVHLTQGRIVGQLKVDGVDQEPNTGI